MRKVLFITVFALILFILEYLMFNLLGRWFKPNFSIILIVFVNLVWGIRFGLYTAVVSGILKDCFSANLFGFNILSFVICAYLITFIRKNIFHVGSGASRIQLVILMTAVNAIIHYLINVMFFSASVQQLFILITLPEIVTTTIAAPYVFNKMRRLIERYTFAI